MPTLCGRQARQASVKYKVAPGDGHLSHLSSPRDLATSASHPHNSAQHRPAQPSTYDKHNTIDAGNSGLRQLFALNSDNENVSILSIIHCLCPEWITCSLSILYLYTTHALLLLSVTHQLSTSSDN